MEPESAYLSHLPARCGRTVRCPRGRLDCKCFSEQGPSYPSHAIPLGRTATVPPPCVEMPDRSRKRPPATERERERELAALERMLGFAAVKALAAANPPPPPPVGLPAPVAAR